MLVEESLWAYSETFYYSGVDYLNIQMLVRTHGCYH